MKIADARLFAAQLTRAIEQADADGLAALNRDYLDAFIDDPELSLASLSAVLAGSVLN